MLGVENLYDAEKHRVKPSTWCIFTCLCYDASRYDYVVKDGEVVIVDEFTGRLMFGRRYSDGFTSGYRS